MTVPSKKFAKGSVSQLPTKTASGCVSLVVPA
jgi:hypothetical protein